jgi:pyruvate ferredoxin oxidoreductase beta subunit
MGQITRKKNMAAIAAAHDIPYVATACPSYHLDLMKKVRKGAEVKGPAYVHILSPCPTGWRYRSDLAITIGQLAVQTGIFPLYEIEYGRYRLNADPPELKPIEEYLKLQGRYRHLTGEQIQEIQQMVNEDYAKLKEKVAASPL